MPLPLLIGLWAAAAYGVLAAGAWALQERIAFPAPRAPLPDPRAAGLDLGQRLELVTPSGIRLAGWYLPAPAPERPRGPGLLWCYGNGETIAAIASTLGHFQPRSAALLVVDYPGYGASGGRATEASLAEAADTAYRALAERQDVDPRRIYVYGRSLGAAVATRVAATHPVAGLVLESPFTSAWAMARRHYAFFPRPLLRLSLDNLTAIRRVRCPVLVFHGTRDRVAPIAMGHAVAAAAANATATRLTVPMCSTRVSASPAASVASTPIVFMP
ncbi:MAG TPA: alpha/beta hydrolase, partial [Gemmatimonadales bacterium]|nr:alpha/beta hydrolase [Gemmatimonadales bacterium]